LVVDITDPTEETRGAVRRYVVELLNGYRLERAGGNLDPGFVGYFPGMPGWFAARNAGGRRAGRGSLPRSK
jgi:hypothetical protein